MKSKHSQTKGQAMVEMAFVIFILVLLVFGITEFGRALYTKNTLTNAARAGARQAVVTPGLTNTGGLISLNCGATCPPGAGDDPNGCVYKAICDSLFSGIDKSQVKVSISGGTGGSSSNQGQTNDTITVEVDYMNFQSVVPKLIPIRKILTASAAMRFE